MAGQAYQPVQPIDIPGLFSTIANLRMSKLAQQQGQLQLADMYEARDRRHQIQAALQAGDMQKYAALDPHGYAAMLKSGLEAGKAQAEIANTQSQIQDRSRQAEETKQKNTMAYQANIAKALEANPQAAPVLQEHINRLAAARHINYFAIPGMHQADPEDPESQAEAPGQGDIRIMQALAGSTDKQTSDIAEYEYAKQQGYQGTLEQWVTHNRNSSSGQTPFRMAMDLRKEFEGYRPVQNYQIAKESSAKMKAGGATGPGDVALIFNYMHLIEPNSTVREGEFATAANSGGVAEKWRNLYNQALSGERLTPKVRSEILGEADRLMGAQSERYNMAVRQYTDFAKKNGIDPADVIMSEDLRANPDAPAPGNANTHIIGFTPLAPGEVPQNPPPPTGMPTNPPQRPAQPQRRGAPVGRAQALSEFDQLMGLR